MMSAPQERVNTQMSSVPYIVYGAPQTSTNPINIQWNIQPAPAQPNVYSTPPMWNVSPGQPQVVYPTVQPASPGYNVPAAALPQVTQPSQCQQVFLQGKPKALGIALIVMAILQILCAVSLPFIAITHTLFIGVPFWGPVFYIIAGSLSIAAQRNNDFCMVKGSLVFNIFSSISSFIGLSVNIVDFAIMLSGCQDNGYGYYECYYNTAGYAIISIIFIMNILAFCVSTSASVYGCRAVEKIQPHVSQVLVIQGEIVASMPPSNSSVPRAPPTYVVQTHENAKPAQ